MVVPEIFPVSTAGRPVGGAGGPIRVVTVDGTANSRGSNRKPKVAK